MNMCGKQAFAGVKRGLRAHLLTGNGVGTSNGRLSSLTLVSSRGIHATGERRVKVESNSSLKEVIIVVLVVTLR